MADDKSNDIKLHGFALYLTENNLLKKDLTQQYSQDAAKKKIPFIAYLAQEKFVKSSDLAKLTSEYYKLPYLEINEFNEKFLPHDIQSQLSYVDKEYAIPLFKRSNFLFVAVIDPNYEALDAIKFTTNLKVIPIIVDAEKLNIFVDSLEDSKHSDIFAEESDSDILDLEIDSGNKKNESEEDDSESAPVVKFVNLILTDAIKKGASDIHFEPYSEKYRVRFRIDGILYEVAQPPLAFANKIASRIKVMSMLDIAERRVPQDGRFRINLSKTRSIDFRVNTCPVVSGEKIVLRILDASSTKIGIEYLGFSEYQQKLFMKAIKQPQAMILVTGPTGSGKTISLYSALNVLNTIERNISTAEDPVELHVEGINQVNVDPKKGLTFASALKAFLRQDPDVIMVGEIRDSETVGIAIKAAQTGHLVLSTLHTNSATETLTRLLDLGAERFDIVSALCIIIAQRLTRKLCKNCKAPEKLPKQVLLDEGFKEEEIPELEIYKPVGCDYCTKGYKGRIGIFETLYLTKEIKEAILEGKSPIEIERIASKTGMLTLRESGLEKVKMGLISIEELNRVTGD